MARTNEMMRSDRFVEPALKIKTQPRHAFFIRCAMTMILPLIDQIKCPFEEFDPSYFQTCHGEGAIWPEPRAAAARRQTRPKTG